MIASENGRISNYEGLVTLTLTLDRVILHTVVHHSSTTTYMPNFIEIKETFCEWMDVHMYAWTDRRTIETVLLCRLCQRVDIKTCSRYPHAFCILGNLAQFEFNVPFQHKYGYIRDKRSGVESYPYPLNEGRDILTSTLAQLEVTAERQPLEQQLKEVLV